MEHLEKLPDPRIQNKCKHVLVDIVAITISAVICGAEDWQSISVFAKSKEPWLRTFLSLPNGIPSHDTFNRLFSLISPTKFQNIFSQWVKDVSNIIPGVVAVDGKTLRRTHDHKSNKSAIHMVSAWSVENKLVLAQEKTDEKSNEITAIPKLLRKLDLKGCIVTIDAMGCQTAIAEQIVESGGDYLLALKGNQGQLHESVKHAFLQASKNQFEDDDIDFYEESVKSRDRQEHRRCWTMSSNGVIENDEAWKGLQTIIMIQSERIINGECSVENRFYISSIKNNAQTLCRSVRAHWAVENSLHWQLDVSFREDESRTRSGYSAENFAVIRHIALNILKKDTYCKVGIKNKRLNAGWDENYLIKLLKT